MLKTLTPAVLLMWLLATPAAAQLDNQIADLNRQALDAYQGLDIDGARNKLERAIKLAQRSNYNGPSVAQSFLALGLVYVAGMNDQEQGLAAFVNALCIQRDVQLDPLLSTPAVKQVFAQAQKDAGAGACGPDAAPPAASGEARPKQPEVDLTVPQDSVPSDSSAVESDTEAECPPGMKCSGRGGEDEADDTASYDLPRFFFSAQLVGGFSLLRSGMEADTDAPTLYSMPERTSDVYKVMPSPNPNAPTDTRYLFNTESPWVPDADSFDDLEDPQKGLMRGRTPLSANCTGDGKYSGPMPMVDGVIVTDPLNRPYTTMTPSNYCVRVATPGFVPNLALRANLGYWVSDSIALSIPFRYQFAAGKGSLSHMLVGVRAEVRLARVTQPTGTSLSWFLGATYGQIQARPAAPTNSSVVGPYAISGPFGLHTGLNIRVRVHRNFGFILSPEVDLQIPALMLHGDLSGGIETAF